MDTFYGYSVRKTEETDLALASSWTPEGKSSRFWLEQGQGRESFIVYIYDRPIAFFKIDYVGKGDQARLHFQAGSGVSPRIILKGVMTLVPLIEKGLSRNGVKAIFFTSHSPLMARFMKKHLKYDFSGDGGVDGIIMAKGVKG